MNDVAQALGRIAPHVLRTPVLDDPGLDTEAGVPVVFKCENLQRCGAFKARGAMNAVLSLGAARLTGGVATHSSGNHGAALARAAREVGVTAHVVMPNDAPAAKQANVRRFGGRVVFSGPTLADRERVLGDVVAQTGAVVVPPYDDEHIIAGQGTATLELIEQVDCDEIWVPVGGGGLVSGAILAVAESGSRAQVVGAEPALADDARASLELGKRQPQRPPVTIADGLRTALGVRNFRIMYDYGLPIRCVSEDAIVAARQRLMQALNMVIEPSAAVPYAALCAGGPLLPSSRRVAVILSGGNT